MERCVCVLPGHLMKTPKIEVMSSRYDQIVKFINQALKNDHLYSNEELAFMKSQLRQLRETKNRLRKEERGGFGS